VDERKETLRTELRAGLIGTSRAITGLREQLEAIAATDATVLLTGETGTGKGLAARALHRLSERAPRPFVHVDSAALSPTLIERDAGAGAADIRARSKVDDELEEQR
jgi:two-component system C4-dicarboxylate transport response regulator DctD